LFAAKLEPFVPLAIIEVLATKSAATAKDSVPFARFVCVHQFTKACRYPVSPPPIAVV
jgi:hypothetical protein